MIFIVLVFLKLHTNCSETIVTMVGGMGPYFVSTCKTCLLTKATRNLNS